MIEFLKPTIRRRDMDSVLQALVSEHIGPGDRTRMLAQTFADMTHCRSACAFRSYPHSIEKALVLLGACEGTRVVLSPLTPSVYLDALNKLGCIPVLVDVDPENGLVSAAASESGATIMVLYDSCGSLAMKYDMQSTYHERQLYEGLSVIEDVSLSVGGRFAEEAIAGDWGQVVVCSCEDSDIVSCAGGALLGVKGDLYYTLRSNRPDCYSEMTDLNSALGTIQFQKLEEDCNRRREIAQKYNDSLVRTPHKHFGLNATDFKGSAPGFAVFLDSRPDATVKFAHKYGIPVRMTFENSIAASYNGDMFADFPVAAAYCSRTVSFPLYPFLRSEDIDSIAKVIAHLP